MEKLNYEEFKKVVEQQFTAWLPEEYQKCKVVIQPRYKVNTVLDYINLYDENGKGILVNDAQIQKCYDTNKNLYSAKRYCRVPPQYLDNQNRYAR